MCPFLSYSLKDVRSGDREGKDAQKGELTRALAENKKLDRQRAELIVAFKKQLRYDELPNFN